MNSDIAWKISAVSVVVFFLSMSGIVINYTGLQGISGFAVKEQIKQNFTLSIDETVSENALIPLTVPKDASALYISGKAKQDAKIYLVDGKNEYLLVDTAAIKQEETGEVQNSNNDDLALDVIASSYAASPNEVITVIASSQESPENLCARHQITTDTIRETCFGPESCCSLLGLQSDEPSHDSPLFLSIGKYGIQDQAYLSTQLTSADYSFNPQNPYFRIVQSTEHVNQFLFDMFPKRFDKSCTGSCSIKQALRNPHLRIETSDELHIDSITYTTTDTSFNRVPQIADIPDIVLFGANSDEINLADYVSDDSEDLEYSHFESENLNAQFQDGEMILSIANNYKGEIYTALIVNDGTYKAVSNVFTIYVE